MNEYREYNSSEGNIPYDVSQIEGNLAEVKILKKLPKVPKIDSLPDKVSTSRSNKTS